MGQFIAKYDPHPLCRPGKALTDEQDEELESIIAVVDKNAVRLC